MVVWRAVHAEIAFCSHRRVPFRDPTCWPAASLAARRHSKTIDKPTGTDHTLTTIFVVALGIPLLLAILTLIDIAVGRGKNDQH